MKRIALLAITAVVFTACGGPSEADIQATVGAVVQATAQAGQIVTSVQATQTAAEACGQVALTAYADAVEEEIRTFEMQASVAGSTPRASIGTALQELLNIQTETRRMKTPACLAAYHERVVSMMGLYRLAYETFAAQGDETMVQASLQVGQETLTEVKQQIATIRAGTVPPTPTTLPGAPVPTAVPTETAPHAVTVDLHKQLTIRTGPGSDYPLVEDILNARQTTFLAQRTIGGDHWYHVQTDGKEGWARIVGLDPVILNALPEDTSTLPPVPSPTS